MLAISDHFDVFTQLKFKGTLSSASHNKPKVSHFNTVYF